MTTKHRRRRDRNATVVGLKALAIGGVLALAALSPIQPFVVVRVSSPASAATSIEVSASATLGEIACARIGAVPLLRTLRGVSGSRSGDLILIPEPPDFVNGGLTHATPFDYTQNVPILIYGPGYVTPGVYQEPVTLADIAPTQADLLHYDGFTAPHGHAQIQALLPEDQRATPALIVTMVWDSVGDNVLERWPSAWPTLAELKANGAWFENATVGASPSNTPVSHATIGTGAFPSRHGLVDVYIRIRGEVIEPMALGPTLLRGPTLADRYDLDLGNLPVVGMLGTLADHLPMMSHGSQFRGGDSDIAITREEEGGPTTGVESTEWNLADPVAPYYTLPHYANELPTIETYVDAVDQADGKLDGKWRDNDIEQLGGGFDTPARAPYEETLLETMIKREDFGQDDVPDLLFVNFKTTDKIGHLFSADGIEMSDTLTTQDAALGQLVDYLNLRVGIGRWVLFLAADHGTQYDPKASGAFMIDADKLRAAIAARFDDDQDEVPLVQKLRPSQVWIDRDELAENGVTVEQVARYLMGLTRADTYMGRAAPTGPEADRTVFGAVLPSESLAGLPCLAGSDV